MNSSQQPLITVLMPAYNSQNTIHESIDSVLVEKTVPLELIVVDDASTDETPKILDSYAEVDPRVRVFHRATNGGEGPARNTGLDKVKGTWLFMLDSDDILIDGALSSLEGLLRTTSADVVVTHYAERDVKRDRIWHRRDRTLEALVGKGEIEPGTIADWLFVRMHALPSNKLFRMANVRNLGMRFQDIPRNADILFTLGVPALSSSIAFSDVELYEYRTNQPSSLINAGNRFPLTDAMSVMAAHDLLVERGVWERWRRGFLNWSVRYFVSALTRMPNYESCLKLATFLSEEALEHIGFCEEDVSDLCTTGQYEVCSCLYHDGPDPAIHMLMRLMDSWRENNASDRDTARRRAAELNGRLNEMAGKLKEQRELTANAKRQADNLREQLEAAERRIADLESENSALWHSASMRIGRATTFVPRYVRDHLSRKGDR